VEIEESVRGADVYVIQSTCAPVNDNLMEMLIMTDALKRASAGSISAVMPYFGYARQDRKAAPRAPISARLVTDLLTAAGANRLITMELHAGQIQGFFNGPVDHLYCSPVMLDHIATLDLVKPVIVSPDAGGVERARAYAKRMNASLAIIDKRRSGPNVAEVMTLIGEVEGCDTIIVDDMIDTAGTLVSGATALRKAGARRVYAISTHPVLSGPAIGRINESVLEEVIVSNTIPLSSAGRACPKIKVLSAANLFGEAIKRIHDQNSVSSLFA
jgi:ribose-phosphate pyrophosphokinase